MVVGGGEFKPGRRGTVEKGTNLRNRIKKGKDVRGATDFLTRGT